MGTIKIVRCHSFSKMDACVLKIKNFTQKLKYITMEDLDDEIISPDSLGTLRLCHRGWNHVPKHIFPTLKYSLIDLDLSYNNISVLNDSIGECIKLRRFNISHNQLTVLPDSLCKCHQLEFFYCGDNKIQTIPITFGSLECLEELDIRNNCIRDVPDVLSQIPCLKSILSCGNHFSFEIPNEFISSGHLFLWFLKKRYENNRMLAKAMDECNEIESMCQRQEFLCLQLEDTIIEVSHQVEELVQARPVRYLEMKENVYSTIFEYLQIFQQLKRACKLAFRGLRIGIK